MKILQKLHFLVVTSMILTGPSAFAVGGMEGGGGKGVLCGSVVHLLDLYEGQLDGYTAPITSGNFDQDLRIYVYKISRQIATPGVNIDAPGFLDKAMQETYGMLGQVNDIPVGQSLPFTNDATLPEIPPGCSFVQVAVNQISSTDPTQIVVYRDKSLWQLMPEIDQVALAIHEYAYWMTRLFGETSSDDTRKMIARMFSGMETFPMFSSIWNVTPIVSCGGTNSLGAAMWYAWVAQETDLGVQGTAFYFQSIAGKLRTSRTRAFIAGLTPNDLLAKTAKLSAGTATNELLGESWPIRFQSGDGQNPGMLNMQIGDQIVNGFCSSQ